MVRLVRFRATEEGRQRVNRNLTLHDVFVIANPAQEMNLGRVAQGHFGLLEHLEVTYMCHVKHTIGIDPVVAMIGVHVSDADSRCRRKVTEGSVPVDLA